MVVHYILGAAHRLDAYCIPLFDWTTAHRFDLGDKAEFMLGFTCLRRIASIPSLNVPIFLG
jgi:hypothetical protein